MTFSEKSILVTKGAGFISSQAVVQLLNEGFRVSIIENLDNFVTEAVDRVCDLFSPKHSHNLEFHLVFKYIYIYIFFVCVCKFLFCLVTEKMREKKARN